MQCLPGCPCFFAVIIAIATTTVDNSTEMAFLEPKSPSSSSIPRSLCIVSVAVVPGTLWACKSCRMESLPKPIAPKPARPTAGDGAPCAARRRLRAKTPALPSLPDRLHAAALAAEQEDDSQEPLAATVKRKHVHYAHVRIGDPSHVQPHQMSRPTPPPREQHCFGGGRGLNNI